MPKQLEEQPPLPPEAAYLWRWFLEVHTNVPLTFTELSAWAKLMGYKLTSLEVSVIKKLDNIFQQVQNE